MTAATISAAAFTTKTNDVADAAGRGDLAARMLPVATDLVMRVRESREAVRDLLEQIPASELPALAVVLAALVPADRTVGDLLAWVTWDEFGRPLTGIKPSLPAPTAGIAPVRTLRPCGSHAAFNRHISRGEKPCPDCEIAERAYQRDRERT